MGGLSQRPTTAGIEQVQDLIQASIPIGRRNGMQQVHRSDFPHASISRIGQKSEFVVHIPDLQTIQSGLGTVAQILGIRNRDQWPSPCPAWGMGASLAQPMELVLL